MRRVVLFAPHFAEYTSRLALEMAKTAHVLLILDAANRRNELEPELFASVKQAADVFEFRSDTRIWRRLSPVLVAIKIFAFRPNIVHIQEQPEPLTSAVVSAVRRFFPLLLTVHDPKPHSGRDAACAAQYEKHRRRIRDAVQACHVHGAFCAALMRSVMSKQIPVVNTAHGVIMTWQLSETTISSGNRVLFFGRMEEYKGLEILLRAARELLRHDVAFELVLAGRGPELDRLRPEITGMPNIQLIEKYLTPSEATYEFQRAAIVVLPYLDATHSGVAAAAFGNGRPVVASKVGGLADVIKNEVNGLLVPPGNVTELVRALEAILKDSELRHRLANGAASTGKNELGWSAVCATLSQCYDQIIQGRTDRGMLPKEFMQPRT